MAGIRYRRFFPGFLFILMVIGTAGARTVSLTILHTTDLHGHLFPGRDYEGNEGVGGLLRGASVISRVRSQVPNSLLVDCGDFFQGAPESFLTQGASIIEAMNWLGYDAVVVGNHEFDWGYEFLVKLTGEMKIPLLGGNIVARPGRTLPLPLQDAYCLVEKDGLRIALVGLTTPGMPRWFRPEYLGDLQFEHSLPALERIMPNVRKADPDILVLLAHMGYPAYGHRSRVNEIDQIAKQYPEFDVILGGHTHKVLEETEINGILYSQAGYHGIGIGRVDLVYDTVQRKLTSRAARVMRVTREIPVDRALEAHLQPILEPAVRQLQNEVGRAQAAITTHPDEPGQSGVQQLLCRAMAHAEPVDIVLHGLLDDREDLAEGLIVERDLWRLVPYDNVMGIAQLTVSDIRDILEENTEQWGRHYFLGVWGLTYEVFPDNPRGERIGKITAADGRVLHSSKRYAVAMNSFVLASGGNRFPRLRQLVEQPKARLKLTDTLTREALRAYIRAKKVIAPESNGRVDVIKH